MRSKTILVSAIVCIITNIVSAELVQDIDIEFVTIGNPGNLGDTRTEANPLGCGAVDYVYRIGKYEITNAQWNIFVSIAGNPSGYPTNAYYEDSYWTDEMQPTNKVSWYEAVQFCNYLTSGDKSQGAYIFSGNNSNPANFLGINRAAAILEYQKIFVIPTEDEWYKAAYYKPNESSYSTFANGSDNFPIPGTESNYDWAIGQPWNVGTGIIEQNGTYDMMGNIWEWNETMIPESGRFGTRGGGYGSSGRDGGYYQKSSTRYQIYPAYEESPDMGLRIVLIPEPTTLLMLGLGTITLRKRK